MRRVGFSAFGPIWNAVSTFTSLFLRVAAIAVLGWSAVLPAPARADAVSPQLADLINAYRAAPTGCGGRPPVSALVAEPALSQVRIGTGTMLESALRSLGYRADRAQAITVSGPQDAAGAMEVLQKKYCATILDPAFSAIGTARTDWQVLLAHPLLIPALPGWEEAGRQILAEVNRARGAARSCGAVAFAPAPPVSWNGKLGIAALGHSTVLARDRYFSHKERDGSEPADRALRAGYQWQLVGENIASGNRTPQEAVQAWLDSPGHCANIMNPRFSEMGAAYSINPDNENRTAYWTQMFGRPL